MKEDPSRLGFCLWTAMSEERCLRAERNSCCKASEKQEGARTDPAFECLQQDRSEEITMSERAKHRSCQEGCCSSARKRMLCVGIAILSLLTFLFLILFVTKRSLVNECQQQCPHMDDVARCGPACPSGWIGYEGKCYYFSDGGRNWTSGQSFCASYGSSLAVIENEPEKAFIMRYKCSTDHWIGLWKDPDHKWKWADGTELNSTLEVKGEGGDCAFLNSGSAVSSRCYIQRNWICSHHDTYAANKSSSVRRCPAAGSLC